MSAVEAFKSATNYRPIDLGEVEPAVRADKVSYWFGQGENKTRALIDVALEVEPGEIVILTGPSGSGKTTLLTLIGALRSVEQGSLRVLGREMAGLSSSESVSLRRDIGFIFQKHNLFSSLTAFENVRMATALKPSSVGTMNDRAVEILGRLGLGERIGHRPSQLSGGQSQRVAIARALVNEPRLILADEPTASLDARSGQEVLGLLQELASGPTRTTVLIVTHDQRVLERADRIVNLVGGRIVSNVKPELSIRVVRTLATLPQLEGLNTATLARLADHMLVEYASAGDVVVQRGDPGDRIYVIGQGIAEAQDEDGSTRELNVGQAFGTISELSKRTVPETVIARTRLELFVMGTAALQRVLATDKDLNQRVRQYYMSRQ
ncbi:ATP-binding cassette domain-containing protein [Isosphaeraceae bacterium EP7]